ncbi:hypothetical protein Scep_004830 [Stephania cephalantha]|uniref:SAP domain-containing protein n=1 Tax=Stephania cephalantha TaxID=152367 RepID=A0AAP0KT57_9MAGN
MDLVSSCKEKLAYFRLKELKDVLGKLGLAKQGKKQDLMDRVLAMLSDEQGSKAHSWAKKNSIGKEGVAKIIDDTYRKMGIPGASDLASSGHSGSDTNKVKFKEEDDSFQFDTNIRCPCGNSLSTDSLIQCEDPKCHVWQHMSCVIIPEKPMDGAQPERPPRFYCEICRVSRADPALAKAVTSKLAGIWCQGLAPPRRPMWYPKELARRHACFSRAWYIYFPRVIGDP